jgi:hypothetical protein
LSGKTGPGIRHIAEASANIERNVLMNQPAPSINLRHLLAVGVALPAVLAIANYLLLTSSSLSDPSAVQLCGLMGFYVLQIGFIGGAVATYIQPWPLRWFIYGWIMALVDLQLASMVSIGGQNGQGMNCLATAILAGQLGVVIVWGILGSGHIAWRIPALLVLLQSYWNFHSLLVQINREPPGRYIVGWDGLLTTQGVLLSLLIGILRLRGYSLVQLSPEDRTTGQRGGAKGPIQFGIRDVLIWTTSLAVLLAIAKGGDLLTLRFLKQFYNPGLLLLFTTGICTALILIVALWAALGQGSIVARFSVLSVLSLGIGTGIGWYCDTVARKATITSWSYSYWHWYWNGYWWIGWMFLTGVLLAASLIIYRTLGYRLVRSIRQPKRFAEAEPASSAGE